MRPSKRITKPAQAEKCPNCGTYKIKQQMVMKDDGYVNIWYACYDCRSTWRTRYKPIMFADMMLDGEEK